MVLAFRLSNTLTADFCVAALQEALERFGVPEIFNTDQGSQFTSEDWLKVLKATGCRISMDGKGRWIDNVLIERLWRSVKYEEVYLHAYRDARDAQQRLRTYFETYNKRRLHQALDYRTPDEVCFGTGALPLAARWHMRSTLNGVTITRWKDLAHRNFYASAYNSSVNLLHRSGRMRRSSAGCRSLDQALLL